MIVLEIHEIQKEGFNISSLKKIAFSEDELKLASEKTPDL